MAARTRSKSISRLWGLGIAFQVICAVYVIRLAVLELNSENIGGHKQDGTTARTEVVQAVRGHIYDRNGVPLVVNEYTYHLTMDYSVLPKDQLLRNDAVLKALHMLESCGEVNRFCAYDFPFDGYYPNYSYKSEVSDPVSDTYDTFLDVVQTNGLRREAILRVKSEKRMNTAEANDYYDSDPLSCVTAERLTEYFVEEYELDAKGEDGSPLYGNADIDRLIRVLWGMEAVGFSRANDYILAENVTMETSTHEKELGIAGIGFATKATRVYCFPGYASHILGQTGPIYAEEWPYYKELGYAMNARVGKSGCEAAFEEYLHGQDGIKVVVEDADGNIVREYMKTQPVAGKDVYLTIDIGLQIAAEKALAENVRHIQNSYHREDCKAGAIVAMDPNSGALLAIASYPTYDLTTFNRDYDDLYADDALPLFNRALSGLYAPGSTFKLATYASSCIENEILMILRKHPGSKNELSLDEPLNVDYDGNELLLSDVLGTENDYVYKNLEESEDKKMVLRAIRNLCPRDRQIIELRYGINRNGNELTQKEVADLLGISQSYISRLEKKIILQLRDYLTKQNY